MQVTTSVIDHAVVSRLGVKNLSAEAKRSLGRSLRSAETTTKDRLRGSDEANEPVDDEAVRASESSRERTIEKLREETTQGRLTTRLRSLGPVAPTTPSLLT